MSGAPQLGQVGTRPMAYSGPSPELRPFQNCPVLEKAIYGAGGSTSGAKEVASVKVDSSTLSLRSAAFFDQCRRQETGRLANSRHPGKGLFAEPGVGR